MPNSRRVAGVTSAVLASTAAAVAVARTRTRSRQPLGYTASETWRGRISSHEAFSHDSIQHRHGGFRYMHTRTSKDPERLARIGPNAFYSGRSAAVTAHPRG